MEYTVNITGVLNINDVFVTIIGIYNLIVEYWIKECIAKRK